MASSKSWVCFRTFDPTGHRKEVNWYRLAIGEEGGDLKNNSRKAKRGFRLFSIDQNSDFCSAIVGLDPYIYTLGGMGTDGDHRASSSRVYRCNMRFDDDDEDLVWERCPSMLVPRQRPRVVVVAGKIFVVGGYRGRTVGFDKWVEVFDPDKWTWEFLPSPVLSDGRRVSLYKLLHHSKVRDQSGVIWEKWFPISVLVFSDDQILFSSVSCSYLYNVRDHSLRESSHFVGILSSHLSFPDLFDHRAPGVAYFLDWQRGSLVGHTMCQPPPSTQTHVCHDSVFDGTSFEPYMKCDAYAPPPLGTGIMASFSGHAGVFDGRLHAHVLLLEYVDRRDPLAMSITICYRHLVYSDTGSSDDKGALLLDLRIKTTSRLCLNSGDQLIDGVIVGGKDDGSDEHRTLEPEKHEVRSLTLGEKGTKRSQKRKGCELHCRSSTSDSVPILCYLGGNIKYEDPTIGYVGGKTELIMVDRLTTTYVSLVRLLLNLLDTEHGGQPRSMNLIFKCPLMDHVGSDFTPIALTNDEQLWFMLDVQMKHPKLVVVELYLELK